MWQWFADARFLVFWRTFFCHSQRPSGSVRTPKWVTQPGYPDTMQVYRIWWPVTKHKAGLLDPGEWGNYLPSKLQEPTNHPATHHHLPQAQNPQLHCCENLKTCQILYTSLNENKRTPTLWKMLVREYTMYMTSSFCGSLGCGYRSFQWCLAWICTVKPKVKYRGKWRSMVCA